MKALRRLYLLAQIAWLQRELDDLECNAGLIDDNRQRLIGAIADIRRQLIHTNHAHPIAADGCDPH